MEKDHAALTGGGILHAVAAHRPRNAGDADDDATQQKPLQFIHSTIDNIFIRPIISLYCNFFISIHYVRDDGDDADREGTCGGACLRASHLHNAGLLVACYKIIFLQRRMTTENKFFKNVACKSWHWNFLGRQDLEKRRPPNAGVQKAEV